MKLKEGMYVRTKNNGICKLYREFHEDSVDVGIGVFPEIDGFFIDKEEINYIEKKEITKASYNIIDLINPQDLLYIDIDDGYQGGIIVPRIPETIGEMENVKKQIKDGTIILKGIVTKEQLNSNVYRIGD